MKGARERRLAREQRIRTIAVFGERLEQSRLRRGLSILELLDRLGLSRSQYRRYRDLGYIPSTDRVTAFAEALATTSDYLLGLTDVP